MQLWGPYDITLPKDPGGWVSVRGGDLHHPVELRIERLAMRVRVVGIQVPDAPEITSTSLRSIRLGKITDQIGSMLRLVESLVQDHEDEEEPGEATRDLAAWTIRLRDVSNPDAHSLSRGRGAKPPTLDNLRAFAGVYLDEVAARHRGAVTRTADRIGVHRSTAQRWKARCMAHNLLPDEEETT